MADIRWSATNKDAAISLDTPRLVASQGTASNSWKSGLGVTGVLLGGTDKVYFEMQLTAKDTNNGWLGGVGDASANLGSYAGADTHSLGYQPFLSTVYVNGGTSGNHGLNPGNVGDWWGFAINAAIPGIWAVNVTNAPTHCAGSASASQAFSDIAAGTNPGSFGSGMGGQTIYPMFSGLMDTVTDSATLDTTGSHGTIPSGFTALALAVATLIPSIDTRRNRTYLRR